MVIRLVIAVTLMLAVVVTAGMAWQHWRYLGVRRGPLQDRQAILHSADAFHALVYLRTAEGADVLEQVRALKRETDDSDATWIYAGKAVATPLTSSQLGERDWSAIVLLEYPSRGAFDQHAASSEFRSALAGFEDTYIHGFRRSRTFSGLLPQMLLAMRVGQLVRGQPSHFPFEPMEDLSARPDAPEIASRLLEHADLGADAIMIVNLIREGSADEQAANAGYGRAMLGGMAEGGYGPMHMGEAVTVDGDAEFDNVAMVYYPGVEFFGELAQSTFFQGIVGDKQLGDTQAVITVPILNRL